MQVIITQAETHRTLSHEKSLTAGIVYFIYSLKITIEHLMYIRYWAGEGGRNESRYLILKKLPVESKVSAHK